MFNDYTTLILQTRRHNGNTIFTRESAIYANAAMDIEKDFHDVHYNLIPATYITDVPSTILSNAVVLGDKYFVHDALRQLDISIPEPLNIPEELRTDDVLLGRKYYEFRGIEELRQLSEDSHYKSYYVYPTVNWEYFDPFYFSSWMTENDIATPKGPVFALENIEESLDLRYLYTVRAFIYMNDVVHLGLYYGMDGIEDCSFMDPNYESKFCSIDRDYVDKIAKRIKYPFAVADFDIYNNSKTYLTNVQPFYGVELCGYNSSCALETAEENWAYMKGVEPT